MPNNQFQPNLLLFWTIFGQVPHFNQLETLSQFRLNIDGNVKQKKELLLSTDLRTTIKMCHLFCQGVFNRANNFKLAKRVARGQFEISSAITPELYDTESSY